MQKWLEKIASFLKGALVLGLRAYRLGISPLLPRTCRFHPSCSQYAEESVRIYGLFRGLQMSLKRLCRCHPLNRGGWDPVVSAKENEVVHGS